MARALEVIDAEALDWTVRTGDPRFDDWDGLTAWLEADPAHAARYHEMASVVADAAAALPPVRQPRPMPAQAAPSRFGAFGRRRFVAGAAAAGVAALISVVTVGGPAGTYAVETAPGKSRSIDLADGSRLTLNGGTRVVLDHDDKRTVKLEAGQALFSVRHDNANPFKVLVGETEVRDIGTVFDVTRSGEEVRVAVSEGEVAINPGPAQIRVPAGQMARWNERDQVVRIRKVDPNGIGGWRGGRLAYDDASLREMADDLSRVMGVHVRAAPEVAEQRYRGTIAVDSGSRDAGALGPLLGVRMHEVADGWEMLQTP